MYGFNSYFAEVKMSFLNYALSHMMDKNSLLIKIENIVDWGEIPSLLDKKLRKKRDDVAGKTPYSYLSMFKVLLFNNGIA
jgi:hypothetical protein